MLQQAKQISGLDRLQSEHWRDHRGHHRRRCRHHRRGRVLVETTGKNQSPSSSSVYYGRVELEQKAGPTSKTLEAPPENEIKELAEDAVKHVSELEASRGQHEVESGWQPSELPAPRPISTAAHVGVQREMSPNLNSGDGEARSEGAEHLVSSSPE